MGKLVEIGRVEGSDDVYIKLPDNYYVYITPEGRIWGQFCDKYGEKCDDGIDLSLTDLYELLKNVAR